MTRIYKGISLANTVSPLFLPIFLYPSLPHTLSWSGQMLTEWMTKRTSHAMWENRGNKNRLMKRKKKEWQTRQKTRKASWSAIFNNLQISLVTLFTLRESWQPAYCHWWYSGCTKSTTNSTDATTLCLVPRPNIATLPSSVLTVLCTWVCLNHTTAFRGNSYFQLLKMSLPQGICEAIGSKKRLWCK